MEVGDIIIMVFRILKYFSINSGLKVQNQYIHIEFKLCWAGNCMFKPWWLWSTVSTNKALILGFFSHTLIRKCSGSGWETLFLIWSCLCWRKHAKFDAPGLLSWNLYFHQMLPQVTVGQTHYTWLEYLIQGQG